MILQKISVKAFINAKFLSSRPCCRGNSQFMSCREEGLLSPQTETTVSIGFETGIKAYKPTCCTPDYTKPKVPISWQLSESLLVSKFGGSKSSRSEWFPGLNGQGNVLGGWEFIQEPVISSMKWKYRPCWSKLEHRQGGASWRGRLWRLRKRI